MRRLWRLKYKSGKRAIIHERMASSGQVAENACHADSQYQAATQLANDLISTSMRNIVQARLRNIEKRTQRINIFQQSSMTRS